MNTTTTTNRTNTYTYKACKVIAEPEKFAYTDKAGTTRTYYECAISTAYGLRIIRLKNEDDAIHLANVFRNGTVTTIRTFESYGKQYLSD